jgi:hypothetical protein
MRSPAFDRANAAALPGFDRPCGGRDLLARIAGHAIAAGFLPAPRRAARGAPDVRPPA